MSVFTIGRIEREKQTVSAMIRLYCKLKHHQNQLCQECKVLNLYAMKKLNKCPFAENKPTCIYCKVHCYQKNEREKIKEIMRFSGPKMIIHHPLLAIFHFLDKKKGSDEIYLKSNV